MATINVLQRVDGGLLYLNPSHVVSAIPIVGSDLPQTSVSMIDGQRWVVEGDAKDVVGHLFAEPLPFSGKRCTAFQPLDGPTEWTCEPSDWASERPRGWRHEHYQRAERALTGVRWPREQADALIRLINQGAATLPA